MPSSDFPVGSDGSGDGIFTILAGMACAFLGGALVLVLHELWFFYKVILIFVKES